MNETLGACRRCGTIQNLPTLGPDEVASCVSCGTSFPTAAERNRSVNRTAAAALGSFFLFWPAILLPIIRVERFGHRTSTSILSGTLEMLRDGEVFVGTVILLFSVVFPLVKLVLLLELCWLELLHVRHRQIVYWIVEHIGRWSMLDVMLLALLVMLVKVGDLVEFHIGPAAIAFVLCVGMSIIASLSFDPHHIWEPNDTRSPAS